LFNSFKKWLVKSIKVALIWKKIKELIANKC
jgi:hypothetical protein